MTGASIFLVFFVFFTLATLAIPVPLFPGNTVQSIFYSLGIPVSLYSPLLDAVTNGLLYGFTIWIVFVLVSTKLEKSEGVMNANATSSSTRVNYSPCPVHFGYLRRLQPGSSIPEECYSCPRVEPCLNS